MGPFLGESHPLNQSNSLYGVVFYSILLLFSLFNYRFLATLQVVLAYLKVGGKYLAYSNAGWPVVLDTFKNSSAERMQSVPIYCRYIQQRYIWSQSRYIADIFHLKICFKTSKTCGSNWVNQRDMQIMTTKAKIVLARAEQKN